MDDQIGSRGNVKTFIISTIVFLSALASAQAQSIGALMPEADLVVAGDAVDLGQSGRFKVFSLDGAEVIHARPEALEGFDGTIRVCLFTDLCCHVHFEADHKHLLFLHRLEGDINGLDLPGPAFAVHQGDMGNIAFDAEAHGALLDAAREHAQLLSVTEPEERTGRLVSIFRSALDAGFEPLLYSAAWDVITHPEAMARLEAGDAALALERFAAAEPAGRLRHRLLLLLGTLAPPGFVEQLEALVRSPEGQVVLEPSAAILGALCTPESLSRLTAGFDGLTYIGQVNTLFVLGHMGGGQGVSALESLMPDHVQDLAPAFIEALLADRTDRAAALLGRIAVSDSVDSEAALCALQALARMNTPAARNELDAIAAAEELDETIIETAAALLADLSR